MSCVPRWATPRRPDRRTLGPKVAATARALGTPLMPWQQTVADVAFELDGRGRLAFREVRVTVPRQSGKTSLLLAAMVTRALAHDTPQRIAYTAQTRQDARAKFEEHVDLLDRTPLRRLYDVRRTNGSEQIRWHTGSRHVLTANTDKAGHGMPLDLGVIDEAFAQIDDRLEQAFRPAMITKPSPQLWIVSTAGTADSVYLRRKVDDGRARVTADDPGAVAYFEWSAPDDADPDDPATWEACMPALGHTVAVEDIAADHDSMLPGEFARAYLNRWTRTTEAVIDPVAWSACRAPAAAVADPVALAIDVAADRSWATVAASDGLTVEVVDYRPGTDWIVTRVDELIARHRPSAVAWDPVGPVGSLDLYLEQVAGALTVRLGARDQTAACGGLYDAVTEGSLRHLGQAPLDDAVAGAARRTLLDAWAWARRSSQTDISPLVAVTAARWAIINAPARAAIF